MLIDKPGLFPQEGTTFPARSAVERPIERATQAAPGADSESRLQDIRRGSPIYNDTGAASSFGIGTRDYSTVSPAGNLSLAARERERLIARAERQSALQYYNIKIGPLPLRFSAGLDIQFTDNVNLSSTDQVADIILIPHIDLSGSIPITPYNTLNIDVSLGYYQDFSRSDQSRALTSASAGLDTGTQFSFDIKIGHFLINLHELPQIPRQQVDLLTQRNSLQFGQFTNVAGITVIWDINSKMSLSGRYDHYNAIALDSELKDQDQSSERFSLSGVWKVTDALSVGIQGNASFTNYSNDFLNDSSNYSIGPFVDVRLSRNLGFQGSFGYQVGKYGSGGQIADRSDLNTWYASASIGHNLNAYITQNLSIGRESQLGVASNSTEVTYIRHNIGWRIVKDVQVGTYLAYQDGKESGGRFAQHFKLFEIGMFASYQFNRKLSASLFYRYAKRQADQIGREVFGDTLGYDENRLDLSLRYSF